MKKITLGILLGTFFVLTSVTLINAKPASAGAFSDFIKKFVPGLLETPKNQNQGSGSTGSTKAKPAVPIYSPTVDYEQALIDAVQKASPSVVSIIISKDVPIIENCPYDPSLGLPPEFQDFFGSGFQFSRPCQKGTKNQKVGGGSGFVVSNDGLILTNKHVIADTKADYTVLTSDGKKYTAKVLARDPAQDLAIIKVDPKTVALQPVKLGDSSSIRLGQTAISIGYSLGEFSNTVSAGVISGLSRTITASGSEFGTETIQGVIQTDAAINPGNSGGPLLNLKGEVIGINTAVVSGAQSVGFAIPINAAKRDIQSVQSTGVIKASYIGVRYIAITPELIDKEKLSVTEGALIRGSQDGPAVVPNSPAMRAGVKAEDIVLEINGEKVDTDKSLGTLIQKYNVGDTITLKINRAGELINLKVTLEERPPL